MFRKVQVDHADILSLDCELYVYRKGCLSVSLNFLQHTMIWRESRQWCNNFVRTLTDDQVGRLRALIQSSGILHEPECPEDGGGADDRTVLRRLKLVLGLKTGQVAFALQDNDLPAWVMVRREIEKLSHVPFEL
jgi:hypothetical protein